MAVPVVTEWQDENCRQSLEEYLNRIAQEDAAWVGRIVLAHLNPPTPPQSDRRMININGRWVPFDEIMGPREDSIWDQPPGEVVSGFYGERHHWRPMEGHFMGEPQDTPPEREDAASPMITISQEVMDAIAQSHDDEGAEAEEDAPSGVESALDRLTENLNDSPDTADYVARQQASWQALLPVLEQNGIDSDNVIAVETDTGVRYAHVRIDDDTVDVVALREVNQTAQDAWWESPEWAELQRVDSEAWEDDEFNLVEWMNKTTQLEKRICEKYGVPFEILRAALKDKDDTEKETVSPDDLDDLFSEIDGLVQEGEE